MAPAAYTTTYTAVTPYLTTAEYLAAPTGVDVNQLLPGSTSAEQTAALAQVIARASNWADQLCHQVLACTHEVETVETQPDRYGSWHLHPRQWPVVDLLGATVTPRSGGAATTIDTSTAILEQQRITLPGTGLLGFSSVGPLQFGRFTPGARGWVQFSYLAGWPNTTITTTATAGQSTITVGSSLGVYGTQATQLVTAGTALTIYDGANTEQVTVTAVTGNVLTLSVALGFAHAVGVSVSAFPPAIKQAVISLTSALIKTRGSDALVMGSLNSGPQKIDGLGEPGAIEDVEVAVDLLDAFRSILR